MLRDTITITIQSGRGGLGSQAVKKRILRGGDGGKGGDVYFEGANNLYDLAGFDKNKLYKAENGENGKPNNLVGANGKDLIIKVPLVTEVYVKGELAWEIDEDKQREKALFGGKGAFGNVSLWRKRDLPKELNIKSEGKTLEVELVLKLKSDIVFLGYPNAGKSSLLNLLTRARAKTAPYAFTTLDPQVGVMDGLKLMDLPGLIDGTSEGKGLGLKFLKHTKNCLVIAHFVALDNPNPLEIYNKLRKEIKKIDEELYDKAEIVVLTKSDEVDEKTLKDIEADFKDNKIPFVSCSIIDDESIERVKKKFKGIVDGRLVEG